MTPTGNKLYDYLQQDCINRKIKIPQLAKEIGVSSKVLYQITNNDLFISYATMNNLCEMYGIDDIAPLVKPYQVWYYLARLYKENPNFDWCIDVVEESIERAKNA